MMPPASHSCDDNYSQPFIRAAGSSLGQPSVTTGSSNPTKWIPSRIPRFPAARPRFPRRAHTRLPRALAYPRPVRHIAQTNARSRVSPGAGPHKLVIEALRGPWGGRHRHECLLIQAAVRVGPAVSHSTYARYVRKTAHGGGDPRVLSRTRCTRA